MQLKTFTFSPNGSANTEMENILLIAPNTSPSMPNRFTFLPEVITSASSMTALSV
jgi:hypothetical protein